LACSKESRCENIKNHENKDKHKQGKKENTENTDFMPKFSVFSVHGGPPNSEPWVKVAILKIRLLLHSQPFLTDFFG